MLDRYHAQMGEASITTVFPDSLMASQPVRFYATQRKQLLAPVLGIERLFRKLNLEIYGDKAKLYKKSGLASFVETKATSSEYIDEIRSVKPGTILFAGQPIADISGTFLAVQSREIAFEHAFDLPITVASRALAMKQAAKGNTVMDFSNRRNGSESRASEVALYSYLAGFDQTSNDDAATFYNIPWVGTMAHYWVQMFVNRNGEDGKHFEQIAFEAWLDANPGGTILLLDTVNVKTGMIHAANAVLSSPRRAKAFRGFRVDSGKLAELTLEALKYFKSRNIEINGLKAVLTGDLDAEHIARAQAELEEFCKAENVDIVYGVGTKLAAEVDRVAGVIFKLCEVGGTPVLKGSDAIEKSTLPGKLQILRGTNAEGRYVADITCLDDFLDKFKATKLLVESYGAVDVKELLIPVWKGGQELIVSESPQEVRDFILSETPKFGYAMNYPTLLSNGLNNLRHSLLNFYKGSDGKV